MNFERMVFLYLLVLLICLHFPCSWDVITIFAQKARLFFPQMYSTIRIFAFSEFRFCMRRFLVLNLISPSKVYIIG